MIPALIEPLPDLVAAEQAALAALVAAEQDYRAALAVLRQRCPHPDLLQTGWEDGLVVPTPLPVRICRTCGVEEESLVFRILTGEADYADRRTVYEARKMGEAARVGGSRLLRP